MGAIVGASLGGAFAILINDNVPSPPATKELLGVHVETMTKSSEFYVPLMRFHQRFIVCEEERRVFEATVTFYDKFCGVKAMFHRPKGPTPSALQCLRYAETLIAQAETHLRAIIAFSDARSKSVSKRKDMVKLLSELHDIGESRVKSLYALTAASV